MTEVEQMDLETDNSVAVEKKKKHKKRKSEAVEEQVEDSTSVSPKEKKKKRKDKAPETENLVKEKNDSADNKPGSDDKEDQNRPVDTLETVKLRTGLKKRKRRGRKASKKIEGNTALGVDVGGFTVIGDPKQFKALNINRILPAWLSNPTVVSSDLNNDLVPVAKVVSDPILLKNLEKNFIGYFFPVQEKVIPWIVQGHTPKLYRPSDICVSAPTGSGKTLAYALPVIQVLNNSLSSSLRAIVVLPTELLATQVHAVFEQYCKGTRLKVFLMAKNRTFTAETKALIKLDAQGNAYCPYDIVVATPGRLVDHIEQTEGFNLSNLKFVVVDEADRTLDDLEGDWLHRLEIKFWSNFDTGDYVQPWKSLPLNIKYLSIHLNAFQKLLFSATLSENPESLEKLHLFQPKLFTAVVRAAPNGVTEHNGVALVSEISDSYVGKFTKPDELKESCVLCQKENKPLYMFHLMTKLKWKRVLCFTNTTEATERLCFLLNSLGNVTAKEISSNWRAKSKEYVLNQFTAGTVDVLVTTDQMARGVDLSVVDYVISYDVPRNAKTYIHRVGRTARAGRSGQAITLLTKEELPLFNRIIKAAGSKTEIEKVIVKNADLKQLEGKFQEALQLLKQKISADELKEEKGQTGKEARLKAKVPH